MTDVDREKTEKLFRDFPELFRYRNNRKISLMSGFDCGNGWFNIIYKLCENIQNALEKETDDFRAGFFVQQVKEKFGGLRFYITYGNDEIFDLIRRAEEESFRTCELCGRQTEDVETRSVLGWIRTLCQYHYNSEVKRRSHIR